MFWWNGYYMLQAFCFQLCWETLFIVFSMLLTDDYKLMTCAYNTCNLTNCVSMFAHTHICCHSLFLYITYTYTYLYRYTYLIYLIYRYTYLFIYLSVLFALPLIFRSYKNVKWSVYFWNTFVATDNFPSLTNNFLILAQWIRLIP